MARALTSSAGDAIRITGIEAMPGDWVEKVIALGDKHRNRLGQLPFAGFHAAADGHNIVLAVRTHPDGPDDLAGYCCMRLPSGPTGTHASLTCVLPRTRAAKGWRVVWLTQ